LLLIGGILNIERVNRFNIIYQGFTAMYMYNSGCQICCKWSRLKPGFNMSAHRSTMPQINVTVGQPALPHWELLLCDLLPHPPYGTHGIFPLGFSPVALSLEVYEVFASAYKQSSFYYHHTSGNGALLQGKSS